MVAQRIARFNWIKNAMDFGTQIAKSLNIYYSYTIHKIDTKRFLRQMPIESSIDAKLIMRSIPVIRHQ